MISNDMWHSLFGYARDKLLSKYDPSVLHPSSDHIRPKLDEPHKGFYIGLEDSKGQFAREGYLREGLTNALDTCDGVVNALYESLRSMSFEPERVKSAQFHLVLIQDVQYMPDPMRWDQSKDGVYFQWGQDYKGIYLPYQIARLNVTQVDIMDRLCQFEAGIAASLWRLPEGLCYRLICQSFSS